MPTSVAALLDIATNFTSGEEAVGAIFPDNEAKGKRRDEAPEASAPHLPKKKEEGSLGEARSPQGRPSRGRRAQESSRP